ncbi:MAG: hypothetical protein H7338_14395 [Candidatus Sericytochromatia bacterium]|nr:hypothetical protein [Candidatus Sericytochromatia bacterium]
MPRFNLFAEAQPPVTLTEAEMLDQLPGLGFCLPATDDLDVAWARLLRERAQESERPS